MKVYCIENKLDGKKYVGITKGEIQRRFKQHKTITKIKNNSNKSHIHHAMNLYGIDNFIVYELDSAKTKEELFEKEKEWIKKLDSKNNGYNETDGGEGTFGWKPTEEQRKENSKRLKEYYLNNPELKKHLANKTKEYWNNLSKEEQDKRKNQFLQARELGYKTASKGKTWTLSEETKKNISAAKKGVPKSDEERKRLSETRKGSGNPNYGRKHSPETKEKMRKTALQRKVGT
jgi:group I intron endonuclease